MKTLRIFISSPSDVIQERNIARHVITELGQIYSKYIKLEVVMWEDFPLTADTTFQEGINYFLNNDVIDIAVFILWSRLGTPLCTKFKKDDGSPYKSGTEYEFDLMMKLFSEKGWPHILTYVKDCDQNINANSLEQLQEILHQKENLKLFLQEYFHDEESNSNYAYMQFGENSSFEKKFRTHLINEIRRLIGNIGEIREWDGNPYVGLKSFEYEESNIFFGRKQLTYETSSKLIDLKHPNTKYSLIVLGESGSGKSSFVKAGLLPFFCKDTNKQNGFIIITPSMYGGNMYQGILNLLIEKYPFLEKNPLLEEIQNNINEHTNFKHLSYAFEHNEHQDIILYIDQFEELFSDNNITEEERIRIILLLKGIISTQKLHVFISMRSDFYNRFSLYEDLNQIKETCIVIDLPVVGLSEIADIVEEPARKACLKWEINNHGMGLNKQIIKDAACIKDLPLIEFALSELYHLRNEDNYITFEAYQKIGKLEGAIIQYVDKFYSSFSESEKSVFKNILGFVITESSSKRGTYVRKTSPRKFAEKDELHKQVIDKLIASHLFISGKDNQGEATISITHEILIKSWSTISDWINDEKEFLERNSYYEQMSQYWNASHQSNKNLIQGRTPLLEAEYHMYKNGNRISTIEQNFLTASIKKQKRQGLIWRIICLIFIVLCTLSNILLKLFDIPLDTDLVEWTGVNNLGITDIILMFLPIIIVLSYTIIQKWQAKPSFKTLKSSIAVWGLCFALIAEETYRTHTDWFSTLFFIGLYLVPFGFVLSSFSLEWFRRMRWKKKYVPYFFNDDTTYRFKTISLSIIIVVIAISSSTIYVGAMGSKEEKLARQASVADELFDGLDNIKNSLSLADQIYINQFRQNYLIENFSEELRDTICDHRELEYARVLLNLGQPINAMSYLYPAEDLEHFLFYIICKSQAGNPKEDIATLLEIYVQNKTYNKVGTYSTADLIWISEKTGRFDIAAEIYDILEDTIPEKLQEPVFLINYGHILLAEDSFEAALLTYQQAIATSKNYGIDPIHIQAALESDLRMFHWLQILNEKKLEKVCNKLHLTFRPTLITQPDSTLNADTYRYLEGNWEYTSEDNKKIVLFVDAINHLITAHLYSNDTLITTFLYQYRFLSINNQVLFEQCELTKDEIILGELTSSSPESVTFTFFPTTGEAINSTTFHRIENNNTQPS